MLGKVIGLVFSGGPLDLELSLADAIADLPEVHVHSFSAFGFDRVVGNTSSSGVLTFDKEVLIHS